MASPAYRLVIKNSFLAFEEQKLKRQTSAPGELDFPSTVILRNLPLSTTRQALRDLLDQNGFESLYDFIYVPQKMLSHVGFGYCFINLVSVEAVKRFQDHFEGYWYRDQRLHVQWAKVQGLRENLERYRNSPVMHSSTPQESKPMRLRHGQPVAFPKPTEELRAPKLRLCRSRLPSSPYA